MNIKTLLSISLVFTFSLSFFRPTSSVQSSPLSSTIPVTNATELQNAINTAPDGSIVELDAGTYTSSSSDGFNMDNLGKRLTLQAKAGTAPIISGGSHRALHIINSNFNANKQIIIKGIIFRTGTSSTPFRAGGVSVEKAQVLFKDSSFESFSNTNQSAGPGGVYVGYNSVVFFFHCTWLGNIASGWGGGLAVVYQSKVYIHNSQFNTNRTNAANHVQFAAGGGIYVFDSLLRVSNTSFSGNEAGYVGGGIYSYGSWNDATTAPSTDIIVSNCTFINNKAKQTSGSHFAPTEGGAFHAENQVLARFYNSRFITNSSENGAGINSYRASIEVENSVFLGNTAASNYADGASGGAISLISNDTAQDGYTNRPAASLIVRNSWFQGRYGSTTAAARSGGGITANGDYNRQTGSNGVPQGGSLDTNRAKVTITNSVFTDLDVVDTPGVPAYAPVGGAIGVTLSSLNLSDSMILLSDATASSLTGSSGGGLLALLQSDAQLLNVTFARNTADYAGGAIFAQGSNINLNGGKLLRNALTGGDSANLGSAIFAAPDISRVINVTGTMQNATFSGNVGMPVYDDDRNAGPINDMHYNSNSIYSTTRGDIVYIDALAWNKTVAQLNTLTITRTNGTSTKKALSNNTKLSSEPVTGTIMGISSKLTQAALGDTVPTDSYIAYAWSGGSATVDGGSVSNGAGYSTAASGTHTLQVGGQSYSTTLTTVPAPAIASFYGWGYLVCWNLTGHYLDAAVDYNIGISGSPNGCTTIQPGLTDVYIYIITKEGGIVSSPPALPYPPFPYKHALPLIVK